MRDQNFWPAWPVWDDKEIDLLKEVVHSGQWAYNGPKENLAGQLWKEYTGAGYVHFVSNGTVSLQLALEALDIGYGDEVLVPGITWQATAAAVLDVNAVPILVDVDPETWCIDPDKAEQAVTERTRAVIPVHLYGNMADMDRILEIAGKHHLYVIEDAAHKQGGKWRNKMAGTLGDIGSFSLQLSKVLTTGEGGILVTADERLAERLDALRNCGRRPTNTIVDSAGGQYGEIGDFIQSGNYRITEFQAAIFIAQFSRLEKQNMVREKRARLLDRMLLEIDGITPMKQEERETKKVFFNYAFRFDKKKTGMDPLLFRQKVSQSLGIEVSSCYQPLNNCTLYRPLTKQRHRIDDRFMKAIDPTRFSLPVAEKIYAEEAMTFAHRILLSSEDKIALIPQTIKEVLVE